MSRTKALSLYIHIPFCVQKCNYCDFLSFPCGSSLKDIECNANNKHYNKVGCCGDNRLGQTEIICECKTKTQVDINSYIEALCREMDHMATEYREYDIYSVFIGGGTPSILSVEQFEKIINSLHKFNECTDITIEANPGTITRKKALVWKKFGINRVSIGLQSANNEELKLLGRIHTWETFLDSWKIITEAGFTNRSIDLISGLPGQTIDDFKETLEKVLELKPEHISAYSLQLEEGTKFYDRYSEDDLPSEEEDRQMYALTKQLLKEKGYDRYEISNYSKPGYESKHNMVYWQRGNYLGLGLGASSLVENTRFSNVSDFDEYCNYWCKKPAGNCWDNALDDRCLVGIGNLADVEKNIDNKLATRIDYQKLTETEQMEEFMFLGLRVIKGVSEKDFFNFFNKEIKAVYGKVLDKYISSGHIKYVDGYYSLTEKGIDVSNVILADFLLG